MEANEMAVGPFEILDHVRASRHEAGVVLLDIRRARP